MYIVGFFRHSYFLLLLYYNIYFLLYYYLCFIFIYYYFLLLCIPEVCCHSCHFLVNRFITGNRHLDIALRLWALVCLDSAMHGAQLFRINSLILWHPPQRCTCITSFLSDRTISLPVNGQNWNFHSVNINVQPGSVLAPALYDH